MSCRKDLRGTGTAPVWAGRESLATGIQGRSREAWEEKARRVALRDLAADVPC